VSAGSAGAVFQMVGEYHSALETARSFLLRPLTDVEPSTGTSDDWLDARQFALWTVERALGAFPAHVQARRDEWMSAYLDRRTANLLARPPGRQP
jgi:hypothetical protein